jgi:hypothetical protein
VSIAEYDVKRLPSNLQPVAFLVGKWRSEHGGKAIFPTIPVFTYGEELSFALTDEKQDGLAALNYTCVFKVHFRSITYYVFVMHSC